MLANNVKYLTKYVRDHTHSIYFTQYNRFNAYVFIALTNRRFERRIIIPGVFGKTFRLATNPNLISDLLDFHI